MVAHHIMELQGANIVSLGSEIFELNTKADIGHHIILDDGSGNKAYKVIAYIHCSTDHEKLPILVVEVDNTNLSFSKLGFI